MPLEKTRFINGQSVIEVIVAVAIFVIIAASCVVTVIGSLSASRLGGEESQALGLASEGINAVVSMKNTNWESVTDGDHGLQNTLGDWQFLGTEDVTEKYTRTVSVQPVYRDLNNEITDSGGIPDKNSKIVTSTVAWDFTSGRSNDVSLSTIITNWQEASYFRCVSYCISKGFTGGTCRNNVNRCLANGEINPPIANQYCQTSPQNTCCCAP